MKALAFSQDVDSAATQWLARRDHGLTASEKREFADWLEAPLHAEAFQRAEALWDALPKLADLPAAELYSLHELKRRRLAPVIWLSVGAAAAAAVVFLFTVRTPEVTTGPVATVRMHTAPADAESRVVLPDGSVAMLHRGSRISFGQFSDSRQVRLLAGEAHFTVAKTSSLPFFVRAGEVTIRDIGTAFNVRLDPERVAVLVTEGQVEVRNDAESVRAVSGGARVPVLLSKGQLAVLETATASMQVEVPTAPEVEQTLAWKSRRLSFDRTPLAEAVQELNRYNVRQLSIGDPDIAGVLLAGGVQSDNLDAFVRLLESGFGVSGEVRGNEIILRRTR